MGSKLSAALDRADAADRYEAIVNRRNAALSRMDWCDPCREWVSRNLMAQHVGSEGHIKACRKADAWKM